MQNLFTNSTTTCNNKKKNNTNVEQSKRIGFIFIKDLHFVSFIGASATIYDKMFVSLEVGLYILAYFITR